MQYYHVVPFDFKAVFRIIRLNMIHITFLLFFQKTLFYFASVCYHISNPNEAIMKQRYRQDCFNGGVRMKTKILTIAPYQGMKDN